MTQPALPLFGQDTPVASQAVTVSPSAREARRSGLRRARSLTGQCARYLEALAACQPATDHSVASLLGWGLSVVNARRNDVIDQVEACGRERVTFASGRSTTRTLWRVRETR